MNIAQSQTTPRVFVQLLGNLMTSCYFILTRGNQNKSKIQEEKEQFSKQNSNQKKNNNLLLYANYLLTIEFDICI